jgi:hypothetical protein
MGNNIADIREKCGLWDEELGCSGDNAEENCPFYEECKDFEDTEDPETDEEED